MNRDARQIKIEDYHYDLPEGRIARYPLADRAGARQLHYRDGRIEDHRFGDLPTLLPAGTLLIGNRTKVVHARLHFPIGEGKRPVEIFCLDPVEPPGHDRNLSTEGAVVWKCLIGGNRRWKSGPLHLKIGANELRAERLERVDNAFLVRFTPPGPYTFGEVLRAAGQIPLPPYLIRPAEASDRDRYQTVFAKSEGSVAAPTAGLHFTPGVLAELAERDHRWAEVTLHVGAGTFKPVSSDTLGSHVMHEEFFTVRRALIARLIDQRRAGRPTVSVGTTSLRCLESLFYLGARLLAGEKLDLSHPVNINQWVAADGAFAGTDVTEALERLGRAMDTDGLGVVSGYSSLLLTPAAPVRTIDGLITNFHQPKSTLLLLVAALIGEHWRDVYVHALANDYRFLSFGDSSLLWAAQEGH